MDRGDQLRYSADLPAHGSAAPPGNAEVVRVRDVLVLAGDPGLDQGNIDELALLPARRGMELVEPEPIDLGRGLSLVQLDHQEAEMVLNACSARGHYFVPVKQFGQMYSLVLEVDLGELERRRWAWDTEQVIADAIAMSRLVLDNGYSTEYAARIFDHANDEQQIMPALTRRRVSRVRRTRDWLTTAEVGELKALLSQFWAVRDALPDRIAHAQWQAEYVVEVRWLDVIAPVLVVAFEALLNTSRDLVTRQFRERVPALTAEVGRPLSRTLCDEMYDVRSRWVHGSRVPLYRPPRPESRGWEGPTDDQQRAALERIAKTQDALRAVLRRGIEDADFREIFASDERIRNRWPVAV